MIFVFLEFGIGFYALFFPLIYKGLSGAYVGNQP